MYNLSKFMDEVRSCGGWLLLLRLLTPYLLPLPSSQHPGGDEVLISEAGKDATEAFEDVGHSDDARALLPAMLVGAIEGGVSGVSNCACQLPFSPNSMRLRARRSPRQRARSPPLSTRPLSRAASEFISSRHCSGGTPLTRHPRSPIFMFIPLILLGAWVAYRYVS